MHCFTPPVLPPAGEFTKDVVKQIARSAGLERIAARKESMGICFIGKRNFSEFIAQVGDRWVHSSRRTNRLSGTEFM